MAREISGGDTRKAVEEVKGTRSDLVAGLGLRVGGRQDTVGGRWAKESGGPISLQLRLWAEASVGEDERTGLSLRNG